MTYQPSRTDVRKADHKGTCHLEEWGLIDRADDARRQVKRSGYDVTCFTAGNTYRQERHDEYTLKFQSPLHIAFSKVSLIHSAAGSPLFKSCGTEIGPFHNRFDHASRKKH